MGAAAITLDHAEAKASSLTEAAVALTVALAHAQHDKITGFDLRRAVENVQRIKRLTAEIEKALPEAMFAASVATIGANDVDALQRQADQDLRLMCEAE